MTTPTQAQIEAAAKAIFENMSDIGAGAKAALIAAAQVGEARALDCACGYDNPDDVCMVHQPIVDLHVNAAKAEIEQLKAEIEQLKSELEETRRQLKSELGIVEEK